MGERRKSRIIALQCLYSISYSNDLKKGIFKKRLAEIAKENQLKKKSSIFEFASEILGGLIPKIPAIDKLIEKSSDNWDFERIAITEKNILRIAIYEILFTPTPKAVAINEALEITKMFCPKKATKFVNGILNSVCR